MHACCLKYWFGFYFLLTDHKTWKLFIFKLSRVIGLLLMSLQEPPYEAGENSYAESLSHWLKSLQFRAACLFHRPFLQFLFLCLRWRRGIKPLCHKTMIVWIALFVMFVLCKCQCAPLNHSWDRTKISPHCTLPAPLGYAFQAAAL